MASNNFFKHWPTVLLGLIVAAILVVAVFSYQLGQTDSAVVTTFGRPSAQTVPGLHFRWPFPFQKVYKFDHRIRCYEGSAGKLEETMTADGQNILVGIYVNFKIADVQRFFVTMENMTKADDQLNAWMRGAKNAAFGQFKFSQVINTDVKLLKREDIERMIKTELVNRTKDYGIEIISVGINTINVPKTISDKVFDRMVQERKVVAQGFLSDGERQARDIRTNADMQRSIMLAQAEAQAKEIRAQGDAEAAKYYEVFKQNPELAEFLRKLDSLKLIMRSRTTLVLDTNVAPFDLFKPGAEVLNNKK